ncbi:ABC transporter substrate-binding protein [Paenibacillus beijingensis]|uniref:Iron ABC transporter substrate-binding protein n=1 Tax=Paenibacillus beijingensis TaxID=1126833 RepID=A0A0D5NET2_9BACL|nr:ABC transporter substrate-binding protein [Paenibacillus beijingensis]AJY73433.1 iron ABC transporter substrate-binding protein [Paenibacillus beijingensis]
MRLKLAGMASLLALTTALAGCGASDSGSGDSAQGGKKEKLTLYTPNGAEINNPIIKEFQDRTGIEVEMISGGTGDLLKRVQAEASSPQGDVFWAGGADSLEAYSKYFEPYRTAEYDSLLPQYTDKNDIYTPFAALPMIIMYNKDLVKAGEEPKGWADLTDPKWKGKIAYADPSKSGSSFTQLATFLTAFGKEDGKGWEFVKKFYQNLDGKILSGSGLVYKSVADKEFALGVTMEEAAERYIMGGANVGIIYPSEGTSSVPDAAALIKGAKHPDAAKKFIDFLVGKDVQELIGKEFNRRSVRKDATPLQGLPQSDEIKLLDYDFAWAASNKTDIIGRFQNIVTGVE